MGWPLRSCSRRSDAGTAAAAAGQRGDDGRTTKRTSATVGRIPCYRHRRDGDEGDLPRYAADSCLDLDGLCWTAGLLCLFGVTDDADHRGRGLPSSASSLKGTCSHRRVSRICEESFGAVLRTPDQ
ncbi:uncharacterized protein [Lolium perenne]|uniref:uncharacterized protein isoform X5 n=1 Tax=Lolium perenne TaxID=4522 RepID=UPI003A9A27CA